MGNTAGLHDIVSELKKASITTCVLGIPGNSGAHELIAKETGGIFWSIEKSKGIHDFSDLLATVAETIGKEVVKKLANGTTSAGTDMGAALKLVAEQLKMPPMPEHALPPVLVLISDGLPTGNFDQGLKMLMNEPWVNKSVKIAIAIGKDTDTKTLQKFIGHTEFKPLQANNPKALIQYIKWESTAIL